VVEIHFPDAKSIIAATGNDVGIDNVI